MLDEMFYETFTHEYDKNKKKMYLVALSILRNPHAVEDAVQEATLKAYDKMKTLKNISMFSTWVTRILINECYKITKTKKFKLVPYDQLEGMISFDQDQWKFFELVSNINEKEKKIVTLRYYYQMSLEEISETLALPLSTVKSRLYRSLEALRKEFGD